MEISDITLITPPESAPPLESALAQNPHLTSLPSPKPEVLAPAGLTQTTGTGEIFKLPEVVSAITSDFIVLPCDLICELEGTAILQTWMTLQSGLGGASGGIVGDATISHTKGGERSGRRGGMAVWYPTKGLEGVSTKGEETDFIATTPLPPPTVPAPEGSLRSNVEKLVMSMPTATVRDITDEQKTLPIRHMLMKRHGRVNVKTAHRDAHIYVLPFWALEMMQQNDFDSIAEDVLGWWAKAGWQDGLGDKLGLRDVLVKGAKTPEGDEGTMSGVLEEEVDLADMSTTSSRTIHQPVRPPSEGAASRVPESIKSALAPREPMIIPPILAYVQPSITSSRSPLPPLIRRVDTSSSLLSISLRLAKLPSTNEAAVTGANPSAFSHAAKVAHPDMVEKQSRISEADSLVAENVTVGGRVNIKESVIGVGCTIGNGSRLTRCLLMDGVVIGENVTLTGCILGRRSKVEGGGAKDEDKTRLTDCEVQGGFVVEWGSKSPPSVHHLKAFANE